MKTKTRNNKLNTFLKSCSELVNVCFWVSDRQQIKHLLIFGILKEYLNKCIFHRTFHQNSCVFKNIQYDNILRTDIIFLQFFIL